ncbi:MAG TPA: metallophosphoesterase [Gemmatimonadota bacterium]|nr:metallophosphoesterase [Gemmatimonadota bacterium]
MIRNALRVGAPILTIALLACGGGPADELLVLHTADGYGYFDDCGCRADSTGGLAKRAWVVDSLRRESDVPILLVDAGDFTGGESAYGAALGRVMVDAMRLMEYDAFTLGEWDLNQGPAYVREIVTDNPIAWVHTNYDVVGLEGLGNKTLVVEKGGRRIGLIGLFNPTILLNAAMRDSVVVEEDIVASARRGVAELERQDVDLVVALSHLSYKGDRALAQMVPGIDLIVSGHGGKTLNAPEEASPGTWIVAAGDLGRFLGRARLEFAGGPDEAAQVAGVEGDLIVMEPSLPNDPRLDSLFARYEEEQRSLMQKELESMQVPGAIPPGEPGGDDESIRLKSPQS